jgi:hypothetical protein
MSNFNLDLRCFALVALLGAACDAGESELAEPRSASAKRVDGSIDPRPRVDDPAPVAPAPQYASLAEQLDALQPTKTRAGFLRFTDPAIEQPEAAPILLARLSSGRDTPEVRAALAEAIGRTGADYAAEVSTLLASEADPRVRELLVGTLGRTADTSAAHPGLMVGLQDGEPAVRTAALRSIARRSDGASFANALLTALADADAKVRAEAAQTVGVVRLSDAVAPVTALLTDADADVRLHALRAIQRIDPIAAASLGSLDVLAHDEDSRVSRLAGSIRSAG